MKFYFDESGAFSVPANPSIHQAAVVVGIAVPDHIYDVLSEEFKKFVSSLDKTEMQNGETKGSLLSIEHRFEFTRMLSEFRGRISLTPVTLDLSSISGSDQHKMNMTMHQRLTEVANGMIYPKARGEMKLLSNQFRNLSIDQSLRIYALANCFREALKHAILFLSHKENEKSWEHLRFEIDRVQVKVNNREEQVFSIMILAWSSGWSQRQPFETIKEIHTKEHLFIRKYVTKEGIDAGKLLRGNIYWVNSKDSWGIRMADIAASIVSRAVQDLDNTRQSITLFTKLMKDSSFYGPVRVSGIFTPLNSLNDEILKKYKPLYDALRA
jgi:hypothetical protein